MRCKIFFLTAACCLTAACAQTSEPSSVAAQTPVVEAKKTQPRPDFDSAARSLAKQLIKSGVLKPVEGGKNKILMTRIVDKTGKNMNITDIQSVIRREMVKTGKIVFVNGKSADQRPDFALSGKITSRIAVVHGKQRTEIYLHLAVSEARTGVVFWENQTPVLMNGK